MPATEPPPKFKRLAALPADEQDARPAPRRQVNGGDVALWTMGFLELALTALAVIVPMCMCTGDDRREDWLFFCLLGAFLMAFLLVATGFVLCFYRLWRRVIRCFLLAALTPALIVLLGFVLVRINPNLRSDPNPWKAQGVTAEWDRTGRYLTFSYGSTSTAASGTLEIRDRGFDANVEDFDHDGHLDVVVREGGTVLQVLEFHPATTDHPARFECFHCNGFRGTL